MSNQSGLFPEPLPSPRKPRRLLDRLNPAMPSYARDAAMLISALTDADEIERALAEVAPSFLNFVLTLTVSGIAYRIAQIPELEDRRFALSKLPPDLRLRAEEHVKSYYAVKPWIKRVPKEKT